jgi:hypothetical protein
MIPLAYLLDFLIYIAGLYLLGYCYLPESKGRGLGSFLVVYLLYNIVGGLAVVAWMLCLYLVVDREALSVGAWVVDYRWLFNLVFVPLFFGASCGFSFLKKKERNLKVIKVAACFLAVFLVADTVVFASLDTDRLFGVEDPESRDTTIYREVGVFSRTVIKPPRDLQSIRKLRAHKDERITEQYVERFFKTAVYEIETRGLQKENGFDTNAFLDGFAQSIGFLSYRQFEKRAEADLGEVGARELFITYKPYYGSAGKTRPGREKD